MANKDTEFRQYALASVVAVLMSLAGCMGGSLVKRVDALEQSDKTQAVDNAKLQQDLKDFRKSFEEFKRDVKDDIDRHHR